MVQSEHGYQISDENAALIRAIGPDNWNKDYLKDKSDWDFTFDKILEELYGIQLDEEERDAPGQEIVSCVFKEFAPRSINFELTFENGTKDVARLPWFCFESWGMLED